MGLSFVSKRDKTTLLNPTRSSDGDGGEPLVETEAWQAEAKVCLLMRMGFTYEEAWHMSYLDYRRYSAINYASSIPEDKRIGGAKIATQADISREFGSF
jgi:hypothetical protein